MAVARSGGREGRLGFGRSEELPRIVKVCDAVLAGEGRKRQPNGREKRDADSTNNDIDDRAIPTRFHYSSLPPSHTYLSVPRVGSRNTIMLWRCITISLALICLLQFVMVAYHAPTTPAPTEPPWPHAFAATVDQQHQVLRRRHQHTLRHTAPPHELADAFELPAPVAFIDFDNPMNAETLVGRLLPPIMPQPALHRVFPATAERVKHHGRLPIHPPDATDGPVAIVRLLLTLSLSRTLYLSLLVSNPNQLARL